MSPGDGGQSDSSEGSWTSLLICSSFYINLPIGAVTLIFILFCYHPTTRAKSLAAGGWKAKLEQFDIYGTLIFLPMIVCLLLALQWGGSKYPWSNGRIIGLFVAFGVLALLWGGIQHWKQDNATVPPRLIKQRTVASAAWVSALSILFHFGRGT